MRLTALLAILLVFAHPVETPPREVGLDGKLARVLRVERLNLGANGLVHNSRPLDVYEKAVQADFRRELALWVSWHQAKKKI